MNILVIPVQTVSDLITNSSSEVLVVSNDDNSYDTWDKINSLFNGWNVHLG